MCLDGAEDVQKKVVSLAVPQLLLLFFYYSAAHTLLYSIIYPLLWQRPLENPVIN